MKRAKGQEGKGGLPESQAKVSPSAASETVSASCHSVPAGLLTLAPRALFSGPVLRAGIGLHVRLALFSLRTDLLLVLPELSHH